MLNKIKTLSLHIDVRWLRSFQPKLPNLKQLIFSKDPTAHFDRTLAYGREFHFIQNNLSNLEALSMSFYFLGRDYTWATFFTNNVKLKRLGIHSGSYENLIRRHSSRCAIISSLKNLEEIVLYNYCARCSPTMLFRPLANLEKLTKLVIVFGVRFKSSYAEIFDCIISELKNVRTVLLSGIDDYLLGRQLFDNTIMKSGRELPHLEHFYINHDFTEKEIIKFVQSARNLNTFWWVRRDRRITNEFVKSLADIRKAHYGIGPNGIIVLDFICSDSSCPPPSNRSARTTVSVFNANTFPTRNKLYLFSTLSRFTLMVT